MKKYATLKVGDYFKLAFVEKLLLNKVIRFYCCWIYISTKVEKIKNKVLNNFMKKNLFWKYNHHS